jgi:hypothetical protein
MCRGQGKGWRCERAGAPASERLTQKTTAKAEAGELKNGAMETLSMSTYW